jgi:glycerol-3-phosphate dehydrogenase
MPDEPRARPRDVESGRGRSPGEIWHRTSVERLGAALADLLVIGGGITGAGIARDAAMRGLRTVLVDQGDLGQGTSSRSSRLIHGGLRYLEEGDLHLVFEALRERRVLLDIAPHLVRPLPFIFPIHRGDRLPLWKLWAGVWLYDLLALFRNVRGHRILGKRSLLRAEPMLRERGLVGGALYYDAQCDDARLVLATARSAIQHGALVATYAAVEQLSLADGRVRGAVIRDRLTGQTAAVSATVVVNATGPWCDRLRRMEAPAAGPLLRTTKGAHVMVPRDRVGNEAAVAVTSPIDGRVMFVLPWGEFTYIGTTDTDFDGSPDQVEATPEDIVYLLRSANSYFPNAHLTSQDVISSWAALRPLISPTEVGVGASQISREHVILTGPGGMLTIAGGKLTTYRLMAAELVDLACRELHRIDGRRRPPRAPTGREPLPGGEGRDFTPLAQPGLDLGLSRESVDHLIELYGSECAAIYNLVRDRRELIRPLSPPHPAIEAQVIHAARRELALRVEDVLVRRIHLYYETPDHGTSAAQRVAELMGEELDWGGDQVRKETEAYRRWVSGE